jgi:hypothetical protein
MHGSDEIESKLWEMIHGLEDESVSVDLEAVFAGLNERDRRISETLEDLLKEVDRLILLAEDLEKDVNCNR